jgi:hypothetical protein
VRVRRDDDLDLIVKSPDDIGDRAPGEVPAAVQGCRARLRASLVDHEHRRADALLPKPACSAVRGHRLVPERQPRHSSGRDDRRRGLQDLADESDPDLGADVSVECPYAERGEQRLARRIHDDVGREVPEVGARVHVGRPTAGERVGPVAAVCVAAAVLDAKELRAALVELVVSDRREVDVHQVGGDRDRLLVEQAVRERARADVVPRQERGLEVSVLCLPVLHGLCQVRRPARELPVDVQAAGLEVPVQVIEGEEMDPRSSNG